MEKLEPALPSLILQVVDCIMFLQIGLESKCLVASVNSAAVNVITHVDLQMLNKIVLLSVSHLAVLAMMWLLECVRKNVPVQRVL
jgi:hypothetical protein